MNVLCPFCQKMQTVPDAQAGQTAACANCRQTFPVPSLMQPVREPATIPLSSAAPPAPPPPKATPPVDAGAEIFNLSMDPSAENRVKPTPAAPPSSQYRREKVETTLPPLPKKERLDGPPPPPGTDYVHHRHLMIRPAAVALVAPIALLLVLVFWFFSWAGAYPGGHAVYTQSALQMTWRGHYYNSVGEKVFHLNTPLTEKLPWNGLMFLYVIVTLGALAFVLAPMLTSSGRLRLPPVLEKLWPWRWLIGLGLATLALLMVLGQSSMGFGLESAVHAVVQEQVATLNLPADTPEEQQIVDLNAGKIAGSLNMERTWWWRLALLAHLAAVVGLAAEWFLHRRTNPLPPRADFQW
jgi:hypothetical protein